MSTDNSAEIDPFFNVNVVVEEDRPSVMPVDKKSSWKDLLKTSFANVVSSDSVRSKNTGPAVQDVQIISDLDGLIDDDNDIYSNLGLNLEKNFKMNEQDDHIVKSIDAASKFLDKSMEELQAVDSYDQEEDEDRDHFDENSINSGSPSRNRQKKGQWHGGERLSTNKLSMMLGDVQDRLSSHAIESEPTEPDSPPKVTYLSKEAKELESLLFLGAEPSNHIKQMINQVQMQHNATPMTSESPQPPSVTAPNTEVKSIRKGGRITRPDGDDASVTSTISASSAGSRTRLSTKPPSTSDKSRLTAENIKLNNASVPPRTNSFTSSSAEPRGRSTTPSSSAAGAGSRPRSLTPNSYTTPSSSRRTVSASPSMTGRSRTPTGTSSRPSNSSNYFIETPAPRKAPTPTFSRVGSSQSLKPTPSTTVTPVKPRSTTPTSTLRSSTGSLGGNTPGRSTTPNRTSTSSAAGAAGGASSVRSTTLTGVSRVMAPTASSSNRSTTPTLPRTNSSMSNRSTTPNGTARSTTPTLTGRSASSGNLTAGRSTTPTLTARSASSSAMLPNAATASATRTSRSTTPTNVGRSSLTSASPARPTTPNALTRSTQSLGGASSSARPTTPNSLARHSTGSSGTMSSATNAKRSTTPTGLARTNSASAVPVKAPTPVRPTAAGASTTRQSTSSATSSHSPATRTGSSSTLKATSSPATPVRPPLSKGASTSSVSSAGSSAKRSPSTPVTTAGLNISTPQTKPAVPKFSPQGKSSSGLPPVSPASKLTNVSSSPVTGAHKKIPLNATLVNPNDSIKGSSPYMASPGMSRSNSESEPESETQAAGGVPGGSIAVIPGAKGVLYMPSLTHSSASAIAAIYYSMGHSNASAGHSHASLASNSRDSHDTL